MDQETLTICKERLLTTKSELLNRFQSHFSDFNERSTTGDEADQSAALLEENNLFVLQRRLRARLAEIEAALGRMEKGTYGICEEIEEPIETSRLLALPWTTLSLEGAEMREELATAKRA